MSELVNGYVIVGLQYRGNRDSPLFSVIPVTFFAVVFCPTVR
jgi:hypothetical protein